MGLSFGEGVGTCIAHSHIPRLVQRQDKWYAFSLCIGWLLAFLAHNRNAVPLNKQMWPACKEETARLRGMSGVKSIPGMPCQDHALTESLEPFCTLPKPNRTLQPAHPCADSPTVRCTAWHSYDGLTRQTCPRPWTSSGSAATLTAGLGRSPGASLMRGRCSPAWPRSASPGPWTRSSTPTCWDGGEPVEMGLWAGGSC